MQADNSSCYPAVTASSVSPLTARLSPRGVSPDVSAPSTHNHRRGVPRGWRVVAAHGRMWRGLCGEFRRAPSETATTPTAQNGALAFARCMRSHGIPNWPDPTTGGEFDKSKLRQLRISVSRVQVIEDDDCNHLLASQPQGPTITASDRADYLKAAACMRRHGFPNFPDPTFENDDVRTNIPSSIDETSSQFTSAVGTCTRLIPAGLPYSRNSRPERSDALLRASFQHHSRMQSADLFSGAQ